MVENPEGFQFNDSRLTTNADETITAAVSLSNEEGEVFNSRQWSRVGWKRDLYRIDKFSTNPNV